ncbi:MAG: hypothetical protein PHQ27_09940, partial [Victivallales bacterium]|nr:hypothetical protein [Victivallales bacterium]
MKIALLPASDRKREHCFHHVAPVSAGIDPVCRRSSFPGGGDQRVMAARSRARSTVFSHHCS